MHCFHANSIPNDIQPTLFFNYSFRFPLFRISCSTKEMEEAQETRESNSWVWRVKAGGDDAKVGCSDISVYFPHSN